MSPTVHSQQFGAPQSVTLAPLSLRPGESRIIDFATEQKAGRLPADLHQASLALDPHTDHASIVAELANFSDRSGGYAIGPFFASYPTSRTSSIWRVDGTFQTTIVAQNTATQDDQVTLKLFPDPTSYATSKPPAASTIYSKTFPVPADGLLKINLRQLRRDRVPDDSGRLLLGYSGVLHISGNRVQGGKLSFDKIIHSQDDADYIGLPGQDECSTGSVGLFVDFSGGQNPFPVIEEFTWSDGSITDGPAFGTGSADTRMVQIVNAPNGQEGDYALITPIDSQSHSVAISGLPTCVTDCPACSCDDETPTGSVPVPPKLTVTGISPAQGLVGVTTSVTIAGTGLSGASVIPLAGLGITATVRNSTNTSLSVDLNVGANTPPGSNTLVIHDAFIGQSASTTFFVQVPTKLNVRSIQILPTGIGQDHGCTPTIPPGIPSNFGILVDITYEVLDQVTPNGGPIMNAGMIPHEHVVFAQGGTSDNDIGPTRISTTSHTTNSAGIFHDAPVGVCGTGPFNASISQDITVIVNGNSYPVRHNGFSVSSTGLGHGSISNGLDIMVSR